MHTNRLLSMAHLLPLLIAQCFDEASLAASAVASPAPRTSYFPILALNGHQKPKA